MKKILTVVLAMMLGMNCLVIMPAVAATLPNSIWQPLDSFTEAANSSNWQGILDYGKIITDIMEGQPASSTKNEFLSGKYYAMAQAAEKLSQNSLAVNYYNKYIPYGESMGFTDGVVFAKQKAKLLTASLDIYVKGAVNTSNYYGAKFEPKSGTYFGMAMSELNVEQEQYDFPKKHSTYLIYLEFGKEDMNTLGRYAKAFNALKEQDCAVELAWNTTSSLGDIADYDTYIDSTLDYLQDIGIPIYLRFGCEMNVSENGNNASDYIKSFQYVAQRAKQRSNIAMVWSPNDVSSLDRNFDMYYPGDGYVDWVGISMYMTPYFNGADESEVANTYFMTGEFSNPLMEITPIMDFMTSRHIKKPVMISECGSAYYVTTKNENTTVFGVAQLKNLYKDLLFKYPQIKAINYFNVTRDEKFYFDLDGSGGASVMKQTFNDLVNSSDNLLDAYSKTSGFSFVPLTGGTYTTADTLTLYTSTYVPKVTRAKLEFRANGNWLNATKTAESTYQIPLSGLGTGKVTLNIRAIDNNGGVAIEKNIDMTVYQAVNVQLNGSAVEFADQKPIITDGRTLVPVRGFFEKMGMTVGWDATTQTVTISKDSKTISLQLGSKTMLLTVDGQSITYTLDVPATSINGRTMIPLRAVADGAGATTIWDASSNTANIVTK